MAIPGLDRMTKKFYSGPHSVWISDPAFTLKLNPEKKFVLLVASFRSGSTFVGQTFDHNPQIQYLFEPFHEWGLTELYKQGALVGARTDHTVSDLRMLYLQQIMSNCSVYPTVVLEEQYKYCGTPEEHQHRFNTTKCDIELLKEGFSVQEICKFRRVVAMKVIRLRELSDLTKIARIKTANVKIVHLVRHPFPMILSRRPGLEFFMWNERTKVEWGRNNIHDQRIKAAWETYNYCYETLRSIDFIEKDPWWKERYLRISHREMSLSPHRTAERIYDFIGEHLSSEIRKYLTNISSGKVADETIVKTKDPPLNVFKNSSQVSEKWREFPSDLLSYWDLYSVESQCKLIISPIQERFSLDSISLAKLLNIYEEHLL